MDSQDQKIDKLRDQIDKLYGLALMQQAALSEIRDLSPNRVVNGNQFRSAKIYDIADQALRQAQEITNAME